MSKKGVHSKLSVLSCSILMFLLSFVTGGLFVLLLAPSCLTWTGSENLKSSRAGIGIRKPFLEQNMAQGDGNHNSVSFPSGVAMNAVVEGPIFPDNFVSILYNYHSNLPQNWIIQLFTTSQTHPRLQKLPGLQRLVAMGRVILKRVPTSHDELGKKELLLSPWLWRSCVADKVLVFEGSSVLCSNSAWTVTDFMDYDWVGAAWKWAKPGLAHEWGGNGAFSLRNRSLVLRVLEEQISEQTIKGQTKEDRYAFVGKKNDDIWFVQKLFDMLKKQESQGEIDKVRLASHNISMKWAIEELYDENEPTPFGVYHTMRTLTDEQRGAVIKRCPEAKRLFDCKHESHPKEASKEKKKSADIRHDKHANNKSKESTNMHHSKGEERKATHESLSDSKTDNKQAHNKTKEMSNSYHTAMSKDKRSKQQFN